MPIGEWRETGSTTCLQPSIPGDSGSGFSPYRQVGHLNSINGSVRELVPTEELDGVLHAYHPEVATTARDAIVNGVTE
jgi:hypothetical protein